MKEIIQKNGWTQKGICTDCGVTSFVNPSFPNHVLKVKFRQNAFKITLHGLDRFNWTAGNMLEDKLNGLMQEAQI